MAAQLVTERLVLRPWRVDDAAAALSAYGDADVARWLAPAMDQVRDEAPVRARSPGAGSGVFAADQDASRYQRPLTQSWVMS